MLKFTEEHEWLRLEGDVATVGITGHAAQQLGDLVYVELPQIGARVSKGGSAATVESVKAASDVYSRLDGEVLEVNQAVADNPALVNEDAQGAGWLFRMKLARRADADGFMDEAAYKAMIG